VVFSHHSNEGFVTFFVIQLRAVYHFPTVLLLHISCITHATTLTGVPLPPQQRRICEKYVMIQFSVVSHCPTVLLPCMSCNTHVTTLTCVPLSHCYIHHLTHMPLPCPVSHCPTSMSIMKHLCHYLALSPTVPLLHPSCNTNDTTLSCVPLSHCYIHHVIHMPLPGPESHCPTFTSIM
jgi:hypothetical protein